MPLSRSTKLWYALGQAAEGIKNESFALFLLFYYTQVLGLAGWMTGLALLISLLSDAITDPLIGAVSDRCESRGGRRHPFMYGAALPLAVTFYLLFAPPPGLTTPGLFAWLLTFTILTRAAMTLFHVPHLALGAELSSDYHERTQIVMLRFIAARLGGAVPAVLGLLILMRPTVEYANGQLNPAAYPRYAAIASVVMLVVILASAWGTRDRVPHLPGSDGSGRTHALLPSLLRDMRQVLQLRTFRSLFLGATICFVAFGVVGTLALHLGTYFWKVTTRELFFWGLCTVTGLGIGLVAWTSLARRWDKKPVFITGMVLFLLFTIVPPLLRVLGLWLPDEHPLYVPAFALTTGLIAHFGISSTMVTGGSMMADITDEDSLLHGRRREGVFFGAVSFAAKSSVGLGSQIAGAVVDLVGLTPGMTPEEVGPRVVQGLGLTLVLSISLLGSLSLLFFSRYDLTRERHAQIRAELSRRPLAADVSSALG